MLKVKLIRDLRKNLLRGHPWVYQQAIEPAKTVSQACMAEIVDKKKKTIGWGIYDPDSVLAFRLISTEAKPPGKNFLENRMAKALSLRQSIISENSNAYRLFNGEGDGLPGLICDIYAETAVIQFDGKGPYHFWDQDLIANWLLTNTSVKHVYFKPRNSDKLEAQHWGEAEFSPLVLVKENAIKFWVNIEEGQKTGFFLDQRDNRSYLEGFSKDKRLINLFSYTGGFSVYAGRGGSTHVTSVDLSQPALELAEKSWSENSLQPNRHEKLKVDIFEFMQTCKDKWDVVMVDPPSLTHSEKNKQQAIHNYTELFSGAARLVEKSGDLVLSSCSSHISFEDFFAIIDESLSKSRRSGQILRVSGQGIDHPFPHACHELRYLKFVHLKLN